MRKKRKRKLFRPSLFLFNLNAYIRVRSHPWGRLAHGHYGCPTPQWGSPAPPPCIRFVHRQMAGPPPSCWNSLHKLPPPTIGCNKDMDSTIKHADAVLLAVGLFQLTVWPCCRQFRHVNPRFRARCRDARQLACVRTPIGARTCDNRRTHMRQLTRVATKVPWESRQGCIAMPLGMDWRPKSVYWRWQHNASPRARRGQECPNGVSHRPRNPQEMRLCTYRRN